MTSKGQAILEGVLLTPVLIALFLLLCGSCYGLFARAWIDYQADQALFCSAEVEHADCAQSARNRLRRLLPWGDLHFDLNEETQTTKVDWIWNGVHFHREKSLKLDSRLWR